MKDRIKTRRTELGLTLEQIGDYVGVSKSTVKKWESGFIANMRQDKIARLAAALKISPVELMGWKTADPSVNTIPPGFEPPPNTIKKPMIGSIACGEPITAEENIEDYVDVPDHIRCDFCLRCKGESMIEAGIRDGDVVYIRKQPMVEDGEIAAVRIDGEATLKRVFWDEEQQILQLIPCNQNMTSKVYSGPILDTVQIEGKVVGFTHLF